MRCDKVKKNINGWLDGELKGALKGGMGEHLKGCSFCQKELETLRSVCQLIRTSQPLIAPSRNFDNIFWNKVAGRQKESWAAKVFRELETLLPIPTLKQAVVFSLLAFFIGNIGGLASAIQPAAPDADSRNAPSLSGSPEYKGVPAYSLAASYLKITEGELSQ